MRQRLRSYIRRRPLVARYAVVLAVGLAAEFGFDVDAEVVVGLVLAAAGVTSLEGQRKVTPIAEPRLPKGQRADRYEVNA